MLSTLIRHSLICSCVISLVTSPALAQRNHGKGNQEKTDDRRGETKSAQEIADLVKDLDYPELQVVPRAADRLRMEARDEGRAWFYQHWPIQLSGLATFAAATYGKNQIRTPSSTDTDKNASFESQANKVLMVGQIVGAGWFVGGALWGLRKPYRAGLLEISKIQGRDLRAQLTRERLAEESLESPAHLVKPLRYAAVISNFAISILMGSFMTDEGRVVAAGSAALAFLPLIYDDPTMQIWEKHLEYKRKIYGPVSSTSFGYDRTAHKFIPTASLTWSF